MISFHSRIDCVATDAEFLRPFADAKSLAFNSTSPYRTARALIAILLGTCSPTHITRLIVAVHIWITIKAHSLRAWPNVAKKSLKVVFPFVAHSNAAPAIVLEVLLARIIAPLFRALPRSPFRRIKVSVFGDCFDAKATTTQSELLRSTKRRTAHDGSSTAITQAFPSRFSAYVHAWFDDKKSPDAFASHVFKVSVAFHFFFLLASRALTIARACSAVRVRLDFLPPLAPISWKYLCMVSISFRFSRCLALIVKLPSLCGSKSIPRCLNFLLTCVFPYFYGCWKIGNCVDVVFVFRQMIPLFDEILSVFFCFETVCASHKTTGSNFYSPCEIKRFHFLPLRVAPVNVCFHDWNITQASYVVKG